MTGPSALRPSADRHKVPVRPGSPPLADRIATMRQPEIAGRTELAQGLAAAGFAVALAAIGGLARKSLDKRAAA
jgi:hypothetical protein